MPGVLDLLVVVVGEEEEEEEECGFLCVEMTSVRDVGTKNNLSCYCFFFFPPTPPRDESCYVFRFELCAQQLRGLFLTYHRDHAVSFVRHVKWVRCNKLEDWIELNCVGLECRRLSDCFLTSESEVVGWCWQCL